MCTDSCLIGLLTWIIDSTMSADKQLRRLLVVDFALKKLAEPVIRVDDAGDAFGGVETSDLDDLAAIEYYISDLRSKAHVVPCRPLQLIGSFFRTKCPELSHIVLRVPR